VLTLLTRLNGGWMLVSALVAFVVAIFAGVRAYRVLKKSTDRSNEERRLAAFMRASTSIAGTADGAATRKTAEGRTPNLRPPGAPDAATPKLSDLFEKKRSATEEERFREFLERGKK
jgi:hypothetical protein